MELTKKRVVITGIGVVASNGIGVSNFTTAIKNGISGISYLPQLKELNFLCQIGGIPAYHDELLAPYIEPYDINKISMATKYACLAGVEAWQNAKLAVPLIDEDVIYWDTALILGTGLGALDVLTDRIVPLIQNKKVKYLGSTIMEQSMISSACAHLSGILATGNQVVATSSACNTGVESIIMGYEKIVNNYAKRAVVGGTEMYSPYNWGQFDAMRVLNQRCNENPTKASSPLSSNAAGFVPSSGAGILILEDLETALLRNAPIYAEVLGGALNCGTQRMGGTMTFPNNNGVIQCIKSAIQSSNIQPFDIDLINGHLTSTKGDVVETQNWAKALNRYGNNFPKIQSTKSMIGHCIGAAGAIESIAAVIQLQQQFIHPSINCNPLHNEIVQVISPNCVVTETIMPASGLNIIAKASFGFGDVNGCIIFKKWENK